MQGGERSGGESGEEAKIKSRSYFILKCNNEKNMAISFDRNIWATTKSNEKRLHRAFKESEQVFLVFSVQGSGRFQGVAKMVSNIGDKFCEDFGSANLGGVFDIEWIHQDDVPFQATQHLVNPWNDNKKVQISRDAQELEPNVGKALVDLWEKDLDRSSSREERIDVSSPEDRLRGSEESQQVQPQPQQQQEFYPQEMYAAGADNEQPQYVEEYPMYSPPPFSPQFIPEYQQVPPHAHAHYPPPHMGYQQQPYPTVYAPPAGNMPPYRQQEYYSFQYSPPRRSVDVYQREQAGGERGGEQKVRGGYRT